MPELPEVETIARQLNSKLAGLKITDIEILNEGSFLGNPQDIIGSVVASVGRRAKTLIFVLESGLQILVHLKMTGQLIYQDEESRVAGGHPSHDFHAALPNKHTRVILYFDDKELYFNDLRKFGWVRVVTATEADKYFSTYGPDAVPQIDKNYFLARAKRMGKSSIKRFILDQGVVSGVGNIYADEVLYEARINPVTLVSKISDEEMFKLADLISEKLEFAIQKGGTTDNDYVNAYGEKGGMQDYLNVYHHTGEPCPRNCGGVITRTRVAGRGTHYCPVCQQEAK